MNPSLLALANLYLTAYPSIAEPAAYWHLDDSATSAVSAEGTGELGTYEGGQPPSFAPDVPAPQLWDGSTNPLANPDNRGSLRFVNEGAPGKIGPFGGQVTVPGAAQILKPASFTAEAFVKIPEARTQHMIVISKRRAAHGGASWSLSVSPSGALMARFDTQEGDEGQNGVDWNQTVGSTPVADGEWHHVALTFDADLREGRLFVDHQPAGSRTTRAGLVYDDEPLLLGRGMDGWLDEVRLTPAVLHPDQFLRTTRFVSDLRARHLGGAAMLDTTPTRVQTGLKLDWPLLGTLEPGIVEGVGTSMWALGCETLDRDLADWDAYQAYLKPLGIRRIRLQGGWAKTEREKGVYDFAWLDHIVAQALALGLEVCLETSYGNRLYQPNAGLGPGGILPEGEETLAAWDRWVEAMVQRYAPRGVQAWMMYNEPNLKKENSAAKTAAFNARTAAIIKRVDPTARIAGLVSAGVSLGYIQTYLETLHEAGQTDLFHWLVYHAYSANPDTIYGGVEKLQALVNELAPDLKLWQGEAGCASEAVQYALSGHDWTELSQAKWDARRMLGDLGHDIESAVFCISDISYSKAFISRYGLLKTRPDNSIIKVKDAYYAVQNVVAVFNDALARQPDYSLTVEGDAPLAWYGYRDTASGLDVIALWDGSGVPGDGAETHPVSFTVRGGKFDEPVWVDLITGQVYAIPASQKSVDGEVSTFRDVPIYDGPVAITDRSLARIVPARKTD